MHKEFPHLKSHPLFPCHRRGDCKEEIGKLLGDPARMFTTRCVMHELRKLGSEYSATRQVCKRYALHHCGHEDPVSATECLHSQVTEGNHNHFFVATQDRHLQRKIQSMPGGAVLFASVNGLHLETPSEAQKKHLQAKEKTLSKRDGRVKLPKAAGGSDAEEGGGGEDADEEEWQRERAIFRRQKAKGPNPLSIKKKSKKPQQQQTLPPPPHQQQQEEGQAKARRQRRRRPAGEGGGGSSGGE